MQHPARTFPDKDLSIWAVVQNEAVAGLQGALGERVLCCHQRDGHASAGIRHLQEGMKEERDWFEGMKCDFGEN